MITRSMRKRAQELEAKTQPERKRKAIKKSSGKDSEAPTKDAHKKSSKDESNKPSRDAARDEEKVKNAVPSVSQPSSVLMPLLKAEKDVVLRRRREKKKPRTEKKKKTTPAPFFSAAIRPRKQEEGVAQDLVFVDAQIVCAASESQKPSRYVECVNHFKEDVFGHGGENLNMGYPGFRCMYLVPIWTADRAMANITGFQLVVSSVEDPSRQNVYDGIAGRFVYLVPTFDPSIEGRIIGIQLFRSRKFNPPAFGWSNTTPNINEGRGGDHLCLQWDLGTEQDVPGHKFRFRFWRR